MPCLMMDMQLPLIIESGIVRGNSDDEATGKEKVNPRSKGTKDNQDCVRQPAH